jgi:predicted SAM-dependent methyltransferase
MKLNLGSHNKRINGYRNVDVLNLPNVDDVVDLSKFPWPYDMSSVDEILMQEFLEHISWHDCQAVINECYRILKPTGKIIIQVPDIEAMCEMIHEQCFCVPKKAASYEEYKADPDCQFCLGKARINPERWHIAFVGAQKHSYDIHRNIFTFMSLKAHLEKANFKNIQRSANIYKLCVTAEKLF